MPLTLIQSSNVTYADDFVAMFDLPHGSSIMGLIVCVRPSKSACVLFESDADLATLRSADVSISADVADALLNKGVMVEIVQVLTLEPSRC